MTKRHGNLQIMHSKSIGTFKQDFHLPGRNVRDGMIRIVGEELKNESFALPLIEHLKKIGCKKLDEYNEITIVLKPDNIRLHFSTTLMGGYEFIYTIKEYATDPPDEIMKRTFLGIEY